MALSWFGGAFAHAVQRSPAGYAQLLSAVDFGIGPSYEVVVAGRPPADDTQRMLNALGRSFLPSAVVVLRPADDGARVDELTGTNHGHALIDEKATAYVCRNFMCSLPTNEVDTMLELLEMNR